ncbi:hypothetical protein J6590_054967, partial [Homalodisca vitripennis]
AEPVAMSQETVRNVTESTTQRWSNVVMLSVHDTSHSSFANLNPLTALESVIELGGLPVKRQKLVNAVEFI